MTNYTPLGSRPLVPEGPWPLSPGHGSYFVALLGQTRCEFFMPVGPLLEVGTGVRMAGARGGPGGVDTR